MNDAVQLMLGNLAIPDGVRLANDVPDSECRACTLDTKDHTIGLRFPVGVGYYGAGFEKVCLKDWRRFSQRQLEP